MFHWSLTMVNSEARSKHGVRLSHYPIRDQTWRRDWDIYCGYNDPHSLMASVPNFWFTMKPCMDKRSQTGTCLCSANWLVFFCSVAAWNNCHLLPFNCFSGGIKHVIYMCQLVTDQSVLMWLISTCCSWLAIDWSQFGFIATGWLGMVPSDIH